jgi:hypothetical protein
MTIPLFPLEAQINFLELQLSQEVIAVARKHHTKANPNPDKELSTRFHYFQCLLFAYNNPKYSEGIEARSA